MQERPEQPLVPGRSARVELTVTDADTAQAVGSGDVPVLGTPRVLALAEAATVAATAGDLPPGRTTVGLRVELDHLAATPVGRTVVAHARLTDVDGRRLGFEVNVTDGAETVARGRVERVLVDRQRFIERAGGGARPGDAAPTGTQAGGEVRAGDAAVGGFPLGETAGRRPGDRAPAGS